MIGWFDSEAKVPNQLGAIPTHPLHVDLLCTSHLCREGIPWAAVRGRDHHVRLRASLHDGQVWSSPWQVHGLLHDVPRLLGRNYWREHVRSQKVYCWTAGEILYDNFSSVGFCHARGGCLFHRRHPCMYRQIMYIFVGRNRHPVFGKEMWCQRMWTLPWPQSRPSVPFSLWTGAQLASSAGSTTSRQPLCPAVTWPRSCARAAWSPTPRLSRRSFLASITSSTSCSLAMHFEGHPWSYWFASYVA